MHTTQYIGGLLKKSRVSELSANYPGTKVEHSNFGKMSKQDTRDVIKSPHEWPSQWGSLRKITVGWKSSLWS